MEYTDTYNYGNNRKKGWNIKWLLPLLVLIICGALLCAVMKKAYASGREQIRMKAEMNAVTYADRMEACLDDGIDITELLKQILISSNGEIGRFDTVSERMMNSYVQSIQLAPDGVVTQIYPEEDNDAGKIDLVHDSERGTIVKYGIDNREVIMQGPFELKQGGHGIAIRNPVYLSSDDGTEYFWGLTIVIIRVPEIYQESVCPLADFGYMYRLYKTESPLDTEFKLVDDNSDGELDDPVSHYFELGGCRWRLDIMPAEGWIDRKNIYILAVAGGIITVLIEALVIAFLFIDKQRQYFRQRAITDELTGLLNRSGFNDELDRYAREIGSKPCVGILLDVDDFKSINDIYGHAVGDEALKNLARAMVNEFPDNSIIGRNGGDEFCIVLKGTDAETAGDQIERFCHQQRVFRFHGREYNYRISLGYAEYPKHAGKRSELLRCADVALYEVKLKGKNGCMCYTDNLSKSERTQLGFKLDDISYNLPGAFFIYKADMGNEQLLYANQAMIHMTGCDDLNDFFEFTGQQFAGLVHPDDYGYVEENIWNQIDIDAGQSYDYVKYRLAAKDGTYRKVIDFGHLVDSEHYGRVFYVLVVDYDMVPL